jgi:hypothetical protein
VSRKQSRRERLISELAALQRVQADRPSWLRREDFERMAREFSRKSTELVSLEIATYRQRVRL